MQPPRCLGCIPKKKTLNQLFIWLDGNLEAKIMGRLKRICRMQKLINPLKAYLDAIPNVSQAKLEVSIRIGLAYVYYHDHMHACNDIIGKKVSEASENKLPINISRRWNFRKEIGAK